MQTIHSLAGTDLNLLVVLQALYEARSVTRAARLLGLSQPAVSHALRRLRALTGDALFVRDGGEMLPTPRADAMIGAVRQALAAAARALTPPGFDPAHNDRAFVVATVDLFDLTFLPVLVADLRREAPEVRLTVRPHTAATLDALHRGEVDVAIHPVLAEPDPLPAQGLVRRALLREGFRVFARVQHPTDLGDVRAWASAGHLVVSPDGAGMTWVDRALAEVGLTRRVVVRVPSFAAALHLVAHSDLVLTAPATLAALAPPGVQVRLPPLPLPEHAITLLWAARRGDDPGLRWLLERLSRLPATPSHVGEERHRAAHPKERGE